MTSESKSKSKAGGSVGGPTSLEEAKTKYEYFWKKDSPFSQWHPASFKVEEIEFNCAEQYMMYKKAMLFKDEGIAGRVLAAKNPRKQESLGLKIQNFDEDVWKENCVQIVEEANEAKFGQNENLEQVLFATNPKILVYASPVDEILGIGYAEDKDNAWDERSWKGTNYLGRALTNVRKRLMEKERLLDVRNKQQGESRSKAGDSVGGPTSLEEAKKKYEYFWKKDSPFSQWHPASFKVEEVEFNCAEQYMMYKKAKLFEDEEIAERVLGTTDPKTQKSLGRKVQNFDEEVWKENCVQIVEEANEAKFGQNEKLKKVLFATHPKILVEASPVDAIWGIGYAEDNVNAWDERSWRGTNYLGHALTNVRKRLMEKEGLLDVRDNQQGKSRSKASANVGGPTSLEEAKKKYEYFWKKDSPFSQWHPASFKVEEVEFNCAEQYMMYKKAKLFEDEEIAERVLGTTDPKTQKSLGRKVQNFDEEVWKENCVQIVEEANEAKFGQNEKLKKVLFATHPKILVEASPVDAIWGIGYAEDNVNAWDERSWRGTNYLGHALTNVRKRLMEKEGLLDVRDNQQGKSRSKASANVGGPTSLEEAKKKYEYFWKKDSPFSQWHPASFKVEEVEFNCAEQYMMYKKAKLFEDEEIAERVLGTTDPKTQKSLGRKVQNFDEEVWKENCVQIVEEANEAKFGQNEKLKKVLFATHPKILVEASPVDAIWGIGYAEDNVNAWDERSWRGTNYLGHALTNVRKRLMEKEGLLDVRDNQQGKSRSKASANVGGPTSLEEAKKKYEYFWKKDSPFSQWHPASFKVEEVEFNCAEQYMMYKKAKLFEDEEIAERVLGTTDPKTQKSLGRKVQNFDEEVWKENCVQIVEEANEAKFGQNEKLKKVLFATHPKILVEASPVDAIWGIGYAEDNVNAWDERSWGGKNYLGHALTNVRRRLMEKEGLLDDKDKTSE